MVGDAMDEHARDEHRPDVGRRRRWFVAVDPIWEAGRHGRRAETWEVEDELMAVTILGDVTIDLSQTKNSPSDIDINAYAVFRDVDVLVGEGDHVELSGGVLRGDLRNDAPSVPPERRRRVIRIHGHTLFGDVTVRCA